MTKKKRVPRKETQVIVLKALLEHDGVILQRDLPNRTKLNKGKISRDGLSPLEMEGIIEIKTYVKIGNYIEKFKNKGYCGHLVLLKKDITTLKKLFLKDMALWEDLMKSQYLQDLINKNFIKEHLQDIEEDYDFSANEFLKSFEGKGRSGIYHLENIIRQSASSLYVFLFPEKVGVKDIRNKILISFVKDIIFVPQKIHIKNLDLDYKGVFIRFLDGKDFYFEGGISY